MLTVDRRRGAGGDAGERALEVLRGDQVGHGEFQVLDPFLQGALRDAHSTPYHPLRPPTPTTPPDLVDALGGTVHLAALVHDARRREPEEHRRLAEDALGVAAVVVARDVAVVEPVGHGRRAARDLLGAHGRTGRELAAGTRHAAQHPLGRTQCPDDGPEHRCQLLLQQRGADPARHLRIARQRRGGLEQRDLLVVGRPGPLVLQNGERTVVAGASEQPFDAGVTQMSPHVRDDQTGGDTRRIAPRVAQRLPSLPPVTGPWSGPDRPARAARLTSPSTREQDGRPHAR
jgi:hypothetical protein